MDAIENTETSTNKNRGGNIRGLIALNGALLAVLAAVTLGAAVHGQGRNRGDYTMVSGGVPGTNASAVYIVDVTNQEMIAMVYNPNTKVLDGIAFRNLAADANSVRRGPATQRPTP